jgi:hypothetical protein
MGEMRIHARKSRGYILIVTLALLVLSATVMVGVGGIALRQTTQARQAADDLQRRWGTTSIRIALLPFAERILQTSEALQKRAMPQLAQRLELGGQTFDVLICDEQAKANVNAMLDRASINQVDARLRESLTGRARFALKLRPEPLAPKKPSTTATTAPVLLQRFSGYGQIFDNLQPTDVFLSSSTLTCWGDGAINLRRAPETALKLILSPPMSNIDISHLIDARKTLTSPDVNALPAQTGSQPQIPAPADPVARLLSQAKVSPQASGRITLASRCHSLWIVAQSGGRQWYDLVVLDESDPKQARTTSMRW